MHSFGCHIVFPSCILENVQQNIQTNKYGRTGSKQQIYVCVCVCINIDGGSFSLRVAAAGRMSHAHRAYACYRIVWMGGGGRVLTYSYAGRQRTAPGRLVGLFFILVVVVGVSKKVISCPMEHASAKDINLLHCARQLIVLSTPPKHTHTHPD